MNFTIEDNFTCPKGKLSFSVFSVKDNTLNVLRLFYCWLLFPFNLVFGFFDDGVSFEEKDFLVGF